MPITHDHIWSPSFRNKKVRARVKNAPKSTSAPRRTYSVACDSPELSDDELVSQLTSACFAKRRLTTRILVLLALKIPTEPPAGPG